MHVGALVIFEGPPPTHEEFAAHIESRLRLVPRYRQKLAFPRFEMGRPFWVDDPSFNLDYHVRHTALPRPGSDDQLRQLAGRIFSQRLDRSKPLWEVWLVQGLEGGTLRDHLEDPPRAGRRRVGRGHRDGAVRPPAGAARGRRGGRLGARARALRRRARGRGGQGARAGAGVDSRAGRSARSAARARSLEQRARGGRGPRRGRLGGHEPGAGRPAERADRPAPARALGAEPAERLQGDQGRARRHRQRRCARRRGRRARPLAARPRRPHRGRSSCARWCRSRSARRTSAARSATASPRCAARCPSTSTTRSSGCAIVQRGDGRPEGVQAGARRRGDRRA